MTLAAAHRAHARIYDTARIDALSGKPHGKGLRKVDAPVVEGALISE